MKSGIICRDSGNVFRSKTCGFYTKERENTGECCCGVCFGF